MSKTTDDLREKMLAAMSEHHSGSRSEAKLILDAILDVLVSTLQPYGKS